MKTNSIRKLACSLALIKVFSSTSFLVDNNRYYYMLDDNGYIHVVDDINIIKDKCRTFKNENKDAYIFDKDNTKSYQYGGNQKAFKYNFNSLISNPLIWDEMQLYFPISDFDSYEKAMEFYRSYFNTISNCGCAYVGVTNKIFETFYGKEEEFEKIFGFPMYVINEDNSIDFNYELLILKFFNYSILYPNYSEGKKELIRY